MEPAKMHFGLDYNAPDEEMDCARKLMRKKTINQLASIFKNWSRSTHCEFEKDGLLQNGEAADEPNDGESSENHPQYTPQPALSPPEIAQSPQVSVMDNRDPEVNGFSNAVGEEEKIDGDEFLEMIDGDDGP